MIKSCTKCKYRDVCIVLCSTVEEYVNQEYRHEFSQTALVGNMDISTFTGASKPWDKAPGFCREAVEVAGLSTFEIEVLLFRYAGFNYAEIAKQLKVRRKSVDNALLRGTRKLKRGLLTISRGQQIKLRKRRVW